GAVASEGRALLRFAPVLAEVPLSGLEPAETLLPRSLLLTRDAHGVADALAALLREAGHEVTVGETRAGQEGVVHLAPLSRADSELSPGIDALLAAHRLARKPGLFVVATAGADEIDAALAAYARSLARERG